MAMKVQRSWLLYSGAALMGAAFAVDLLPFSNDPAWVGAPQLLMLGLGALLALAWAAGPASPSRLAWAGVALLAAALALDRIPSPWDAAWFGREQAVLLGLGVIFLLIALRRDTPESLRWPTRLTSLLLAATALAGFWLYPGQWSGWHFAGWALLAIYLTPACRLRALRALVLIAPTLLVWVLLLATLEIYLRSDYSIYRHFGRYGKWPARLEPTLNARRYRDVERELRKPDGVVRVLVLGDSITWGQGVADDEVFTRRLAGRAGPDVEIISVAECGWGTEDQLWALQDHGLQHQPDLVLVALCSNDPGPPRGQPVGQQPEWRIFTRIPLDLDALRFVDFHINRWGDARGWRYTSTEWEQDIYNPSLHYWPAWQRAVAGMARVLQTSNVPALAVTVPNTAFTEAYRTEYDLLTREFEMNGFQTLNLWSSYTQTFAGVKSHRELFALPNDGHPNAAVHDFYAERIWPFIKPWVERARAAARPDPTKEHLQ
jgi:lysophospholipase L1-like esterase